MTKARSTFTVGQRVKFVNGFAIPGGFVPPNATAEVQGMTQNAQGTLYQVITKWKLGTGQVAAWEGTVDAPELTSTKGRAMFPGEAPPTLGERFGLTGKRNDGKALGTVVTQDSAEVQAHLVTGQAPQAPGLLVTSGAGITPERRAMIGQACPSCGGTLVEHHGVLRGGKDAGKSYAIVKCDANCGGTIDPRGQFVMKPTVAQALGTAQASKVQAHQAAHAQVLQAITAAVGQVPPQAPAQAPQAAQEAGTPVQAPVAPPAAPKAPKAPLLQFPVKKASRVSSDVRVMTKQKTTDMTFSLRKLRAWAVTSIALGRLGVPTNEAVALGFRLVAFDRELPETQEKLTQLFQSHFGYVPSLASKHPATERTALVEMCLAQGLNLWIAGPTGCGKTHDVLHTLKAMKRPYIRIQGGKDVTRESLVGSMALAAGGVSVFVPGPLTICMQNGWVLVIDEMDKYRDAVVTELTAVAEGNPLVLSDDQGREVAAQPGFGLVATGNTVGLGEGTIYADTVIVNEALRDRFVFVRADYDDARDEGLLLDTVLALGGVAV